MAPGSRPHGVSRAATQALLRWLPCGVAVTVLAGLGYALVQQDLRQTANDPQVQLAEDAAARLNAGAAPASILPGGGPVDMGTSLAPFLIVYDGADHALAATGTLDGATPVPPAGVTASAGGAEDRVTWQPRTGVRVAAVVVSFRGGAVLAGRSLRLVEQREDDALGVTIAGWVCGMAGTFVACLLITVMSRRRRPAPGTDA